MSGVLGMDQEDEASAAPKRCHVRDFVKTPCYSMLSYMQDDKRAISPLLLLTTEETEMCSILLHEVFNFGF